MEDLATDRIYRLMVAQRIKHGVTTAEAVSKIYDEEVEKLIELKKDIGTPANGFTKRASWLKKWFRSARSIPSKLEASLD